MIIFHDSDKHAPEVIYQPLAHDEILGLRPAPTATGLGQKCEHPLLHYHTPIRTSSRIRVWEARRVSNARSITRPLSAGARQADGGREKLGGCGTPGQRSRNQRAR